MAPLRLIGKVSLQDEITMLETLRDKLLAVRGQARLIADSTGDEYTRDLVLDTAEGAGSFNVVVTYLVERAKEAQRTQGDEAGRVTLREDLGRS
jgi:hypothetical protein